ncbi:LysR family transcriptional regulator [Hansschlegelia plantiphila]|uniref:LysR family transcriptional regulator n=1 Tax=Hansschlegelia plantiphila TaxID=374655 RepID=A0A9W6MVZ9_9HYPH|nr:LysR family transcriptional regulator [Hansschlegelia plantiphila]GLK68548.1 LysR family transcriptional regulator [Hansschlegelia plantiphila]
MDKLVALRAFVQAGETRSFVAAGRQLGLSPSAVGKAIARLEDELGVRLFHRSTRSMTLTEEGAAYFDRCRQVLGDLKDAETALRAEQARPAGVLKVSLPLVGMLLIPVIAKFMAAYPEVLPDLDFTDRMVDVIEEGFDVVIRTGEPADSRLMSRRLGGFSHSIVAAPAYLEQHGRPRAPADLMRHACLHHRYPSTGRLEAWPLRQDGERLDPLPVRATASTIEPLVDLAAQGFGIACLPRFAVERHLAEGALEEVMSDVMVASGQMRALWPSTKHLSPKVRVFVEHMAAHLFTAAKV